MRRQNIWFYTEDYAYYFDMHPQNIQSALYFILMRMTGYVFDIPLHGIKWLAGLADFAVAILCVVLCAGKYEKNVRKSGVDKIRFLVLYAACLFTPVVYLRGAVWAQIDSVALVFLLGAACAWEYFEQKGMIAAMLSASVGVALYPPFLPVVIWYCLVVKKEEMSCGRYLWLPVAGFAAVWEIISGLALGYSPKQSVLTLINWITYHPQTGIVYKSLGEWMWQQLLLFSLVGVIISLLAVFRKKLSLFTGIVIQLVFAVCYGIALGW